MTLARCHTHARTHARAQTHAHTHARTHTHVVRVGGECSSYRRLKVATRVLVERSVVRVIVRSNTHDSTDSCCVPPISLFSTRLDVTQRREIGGAQQHTDAAKHRHSTKSHREKKIGARCGKGCEWIVSMHERQIGYPLASGTGTAVYCL